MWATSIFFGNEAAVERGCCRLSDGRLLLLLTVLQRVPRGLAHPVWRMRAGVGLSALPLRNDDDIVVPYCWAPAARLCSMPRERTARRHKDMSQIGAKTTALEACATDTLVACRQQCPFASHN